MMFRLLVLWILCFLGQVWGRNLAAAGNNNLVPKDPLPGLVTWDKYSMSIRGERMFIFAGEFHPFRLPSPGLWLDVFQKIKSMGFNAVSFYTYWGLVEGKRGTVRFDGVFALDEFFNAAAEAGIYLIARPGPYINAETAAGGYPGWTLRISAPLRSDEPEFLSATELYAATVGKLIARAQISNGGPVVVLQPENEYDTWPGVNNSDFPAQLNRDYMEHVKNQFKNAGVIVPQMVNDHLNQGNWAPGSGEGATDLYGIDAYPLRYDCAHPDVWPTIRWPTNWQLSHEQYSPNTPFFVAEFQGGSGTGWGSVNQDGCNALFNMEAVRVLWKNNYSFAIKIFNTYMTCGNTNWGNLGYMGGDTSYDYGAAITEDRQVWREKYSEQKLEANFFKVSPAYLTSVAGNASNGTYGAPMSIAVTPVFGTDHATNFYVIRHADWTSTNTTSYSLDLPTRTGNISIPQLGGKLVLTRRDSKIHVTDYDVGGVNLIYSTAEIFTWAKDETGKRTLVLYGGAGELHELAINLANLTSDTPVISSTDSAVTHKNTKSQAIVQWKVSEASQVVTFGNELEIHLVWRNTAYSYWALELEAKGPIGNYSSPSKSSVIIHGGYLIRTASIEGQVLSLTGDVNGTTDLELVYEPTGKVRHMVLNGHQLPTTVSNTGKLVGQVAYKQPNLRLPDFSSQTWRYLDSLPEIQTSYDDSAWTVCNHLNSTNPQALLTPTSLYATDYGYHTGSLIYRGHFVANGEESSLFLNVSGGTGSGYSLWLDSQFVTSYNGGNATLAYIESNVSLAGVKISRGKSHALTVLIDHMGQTEEPPGTDAIKAPMGLVNFALSGHSLSDVTWKLTGNLGGEDYQDLDRGPRNEGAMFAERQGYHQPHPPSSKWKVASPIHDGVGAAGVGFYTTTFQLDVPEGYDAPMSFVFPDIDNSTNYRCQLFVNGWQFGKYLSNLGPQTEYPVPEGILNHNGENTVAISLWALDGGGARLKSLALKPMMPVWSGYRRPWASPQPNWQLRHGAY